MFFDVPRFHSGGETIHAIGFHEEWGGKGFNQAIAAARQDASVSFLGAVSSSDVKPLKEFCSKEGVRAGLAAKKNATASAAILTDGTGETRVTVYAGAELAPKDVDGFAEAIATADILLLNNEVPEEVNLRASEIAAEHGVRIVFNPAPARPLPLELVSRVFLFTPNEFEERELGEVPCEVVTTLGAKGCRIRSTGEVIPAPRVQAVDRLLFPVGFASAQGQIDRSFRLRADHRGSQQYCRKYQSCFSHSINNKGLSSLCIYRMFIFSRMRLFLPKQATLSR